MAGGERRLVEAWEADESKHGRHLAGRGCCFAVGGSILQRRRVQAATAVSWRKGEK